MEITEKDLDVLVSAYEGMRIEFDSLNKLTDEIKNASLELESAIAPYREEYLRLQKQKIMLIHGLYGNLPEEVTSLHTQLIVSECHKFLDACYDEEVEEVLYLYCNSDKPLQADGHATYENASTKGSEPNKADQAEESMSIAYLKACCKDSYRALMKVFHPDKERNEKKKVQNEAIAKDITHAYMHEDLLGLLAYEAMAFPGFDRFKGKPKHILDLYLELIGNKEQETKDRMNEVKVTNHTIYNGMCVAEDSRKVFMKQVVSQIHADLDKLRAHNQFLASSPGLEELLNLPG